MKRKRLVILILVGLLGVHASVAAAPNAEKIDSSFLSRQFKSCSIEAKNELDLSQRLCNVYEKAETYLKELEASLIKKMETKEEKDLFVKASKAWLEYINLTCQYDTNDLGSMRGSVSCSCHIELQLSRIRALEKYQECLQTDDCGRPILLYRQLSLEE